LIACVLWQGKDRKYNPLHVARLKDQAEHFAPGHRFVCLSNVPVPCERIPLREGWPGWWSKLELFRPGLFEERVLYLDLDVTVIDSLEPLINFPAPFVSISDYLNPLMMNSSVMAFDPDAGIAAFSGDAVGKYRGGDQEWITQAVPGWDKFPRHWCPSWKGQVQTFGIPREAKVVVYHGEPKPWSMHAA